jgi:transmembrane sensor
MDGSTYKWSDLIIKYLKKEIKPIELDELNNHMSVSRLKQEQFNEISNAELFKQQLQHDLEIDTEAAWNQLLNEYNISYPKRVIPFYKRSSFWYAAAVIALIISFGWYYLFTGNKNLNHIRFADYTYLQINGDAKYYLETLPTGVITTIGNAKIINEDSMIVIESDNSSLPQPKCICNILFSAPGKQWKLKLPDGSKVTLNAASTIKFPLNFDTNERLVEIKGEAYFEIAKNVHTPFVVKTKDNIKVRALGTSFNIASYENEDIKTTLVTGKIEIVKGRESRILNPGQQARFIKERIIVDSADVDQALAWTKHQFSFENRDIREIMNEIGRWYNYRVELKGTFSQKAYSGNFPRETKLSDILEILQLENKIKIEQKDRTLYVTGYN